MFPELLAPAGDMDSAKAAINGGADVIYIGGKNFSARSSAANFDLDEIEILINYAALRGVKVYVAINTLYSNDELPKVLKFAADMYKKGAAALILQDIGLASLIKKNIPEIELHASTQMTVHSLESVNFMEKAGFSRVILSRELSLDEVKEINEKANIKTEAFVHGALCVSYSGQCLLSSLVGARSGNRGRCAQPCRLTYDLIKNGESLKHGHLLSPKDMMTLEVLDEIISSGVSALKIEGRLKSPEYVYTVTKAYREKLDAKKLEKGVIKDVTQIFNRGGSFSTGYYFSHSDLDMMSIKSPKSTGVFCGTVVKTKGDKISIRFVEDMIPGDGIEVWVNDGDNVGTGINKIIKRNDIVTLSIEGNVEVGNDVFKSFDKRLFDESKKGKLVDTKKVKVAGEIYVKINEPLKIKLRVSVNDKICEVEYSGGLAETASKAPISNDELINQLKKTGNTTFVIDFEKIEIDENIFVGKSTLNELRREALKLLEEEIISKIKRKEVNELVVVETTDEYVEEQKLTVQISDIDDLDIVLEHNISRVYIDFNDKTLRKLSDLQKTKAEIFLAVPQISKNENEESIKNLFESLENTKINGYLVSTYGQLNILNELKTTKKIALDYSFNIFNNQSKEYFKNYTRTYSPELNVNQLKYMDEYNSEIIVYGRQTLMALQCCPIGMYSGAEKNGKYCSKEGANETYFLRDRLGFDFPIKTDCENCIAYIKNSKTLDTAVKFNEIKNTGIEYLRLVFTDETSDEIRTIIKKYESTLNGEKIVERNIQNTYGHFFRGVD